MKHLLYSRRGILRALLAVSVGSIGGCVFSAGGAGPGALEIDNRRAEQLTITVEIARTSEDTNDVRHADQTPAPESTPLSARKGTFTVDANEELIKDEFVTEPGAYRVIARLKDGGDDPNWVRISKATDGGIASGYIRVDIMENGRVRVGQGAKV